MERIWVYFLWEGCNDDIACNYNEFANTNDGTCRYPCSNEGGCVANDSEYETDFDLFDCSGNCIVGLDCVGECGGDSTNVETCTGCMDDGYQQWSPNSGSPACDYKEFVTIQGECDYIDCAGNCPDDVDYVFIELDDCGECGGDGSTCSDCNGIPNGSAYMDGGCGCVGGDTENVDAFDIGIDSLYLNIPSGFPNHRIPVNVSNVGILNSFYMELDYDSIYIQIVDFIDGIDLDNYDYELVHSDSIINNSSIKRARFSLFYSPHPFDCSQYNNQQQCEISDDCFWNSDNLNCERKLNQFSNECNDENKYIIFQIELNASEVTYNTETPISIHNLVLNENPLDIIKDRDIMVYDPEGCNEPTACNYNSSTLFPDNDVCEYPGEGEWVDWCDCEKNEPDDCGECGGEQNDGDIDGDGDVCEIDCDDGLMPDCNKDCCDLSIEGDCAYIDSNCGVDFCVGGNTDNECILNCANLEEECTGDGSYWDDTDCWNGSAYKDFCGNCIAGPDDIDCFRYSFNVYNSNGYIIENDIVPELDTFYVSLYMYPQDPLVGIDLEAIDVKLGFDTSILSLEDNWSINPNDFNIEGDLTSELLANSDYILVGAIIDTTFRALIYGTSNELYQGDSANILFLQFSSSGTDGDSTLINYNEIIINETHIMKEQNYTPKMIYFGDCSGVINGTAELDDCGVCEGDGPEEGFDCAGEPLSINESLIPQNFTLSQNYPNPFNPITYIQYSVPNYDFITIDIINISGQIINTIVQSSHQPGNYEIMWDGTNYYGISVPSGIYFYKLDADEFISVKKLVLLK